MILVNELKGRIIANGLTQAQMADILGITPKTFHLKMKKGVFDSDEIEQMISILKIENPVEIFFCKESHLEEDRKKRKESSNEK